MRCRWRPCWRHRLHDCRQNGTCKTLVSPLPRSSLMSVRQRILLRVRASRTGAEHSVKPDANEKPQAALRFSRASARSVSFLSVAFSSERVSCRTEAQSWRPSSRAQAIRVP